MDRVETCVIRSDDGVILDLAVTNNDADRIYIQCTILYNILYNMLPYYCLSNM